MNVEPLGVVGAVLPRDDVRGAQQVWVRDSGQRATALPVGQQPISKDVLADALDDETLGFGGVRQVAGLVAEILERGFRKRACEGIDSWKYGVEFGERGETIAAKTGAGDVGARMHQFLDNAGVVEGKKPRTRRPRCGKVDHPLRGCGAKACPTSLLSHRAAITILPSGLIAFLGDDESLGRLDHRPSSANCPLSSIRSQAARTRRHVRYSPY